MFPTGFDSQPSLANASIMLRALQAADEPALTAAAADPLIWAGHPANDRHQPAVFGPYFHNLLASRATLLALGPDGETLGCSRYYPAPDVPGSISIGFTFLIRKAWGGHINREMKSLMLEHAFARVSEVWFHIAPTNLRSQAATLKLGARFSHEGVLNLAVTPSNWKCYVLTKADWQAES